MLVSRRLWLESGNDDERGNNEANAAVDRYIRVADDRSINLFVQHMIRWLIDRIRGHPKRDAIESLV